MSCCILRMPLHKMRRRRRRIG